MENLPVVTLEDMRKEAELFKSVYPALFGEIVRIENARGKLNDFQLLAAVSYAKTGLGILNFERRQTINAIFEAFTTLYRKNGLDSANQWAQEVFGYDNPTGAVNTMESVERTERLEKLAYLIQLKEAELLELYREYYQIQNNTDPQ